jgi:hypothetical protein
MRRSNRKNWGACSKAWHTCRVSWLRNQRLPQRARLFKFPEGDHPATITLLDQKRSKDHPDWWSCSIDDQCRRTRENCKSQKLGICETANGNTTDYVLSREPQLGTLPFGIYEHFGFVCEPEIQRFDTSGWHFAGHPEVKCPNCGAFPLHGFRKPFTNKNGRVLHYWALLCLVCKDLYEPAQLDVSSQTVLKQHAISPVKAKRNKHFQI